MRSITAVVALSACLAVPSLAAAQNREHQQMFADLRMLQEQVQQLRLTVNTLAEALKAVGNKQDEQANAQRKAFADQRTITDSMTDSIRILREKGDDTNVRISTAAHEIENLRQAIQTLQTSVVQAMAQQAAAPAGGVDASGNPVAGGTQTGGTPPAPTQSAEELYKRAFGDYIAGHWDLAVPGFQAYLTTFPKAPNAAQAQFLLAESYLGWSNIPEAIKAYTVVIANYKGSDVEDDAYYKRGMSYEQLGQKDQARADFQYVVKNFAESTFAPLAKAALERIK